MKLFSTIIFLTTTFCGVSQTLQSELLNNIIEEDSSYIDSKNRWVGVIREKVIDSTKFEFDGNHVNIMHTVEIRLNMYSDSKESGLRKVDSIRGIIFPEEFPTQIFNLGQLSSNCIENCSDSTSKKIEANIFKQVQRAEVKSLLAEILNSYNGRMSLEFEFYKNMHVSYSVYYWGNLDPEEIIRDINPIFRNKCFFTASYGEFRILVFIED